MWLHVDDIASSNDVMTRIESEHFSIKRLGNIKQLLGMEVNRAEDGSITLTQTQYVNKILDCHRMNESNLVAGSLMYAAITTRPDISYAVQMLFQYSINPGPVHYTALKRVFRYLRGTSEIGITYRSKPISSIEFFSDADWGNNIDHRRSITGYVSMFAGGALTWSSTYNCSINDGSRVHGSSLGCQRSSVASINNSGTRI
jgi:hypothetical protein